MENCTLIHNILYTITLEESENMFQCNPDCVETKTYCCILYSLCICIPDLDDVISLAYTDAYAANFIIWKWKKNKQANQLMRMSKTKCIQFLQDLYPLSETNFKDFLRTQIESSRTLNFTLNPSNSQDFKINSLDGLHKFPTM